MPLARIVTSDPEQASGVAEHLRARGYTVEFVDPASSRITPADLDLDLQGVGREETLSRGIAALEAAQGQRRAVAYDITGRPVSFEEEEEPPSARGNAISQAWRGLRSAAGEMMENLRLSIGHLGEWFAEARQTVQQHRAHSQELRRLRAESTARRREEQAKARDAERARHEQEAVARRAAIAAAQQRTRDPQEQARRERLAETERRLLESYRREARRDVLQERFAAEQQQSREVTASAEATIIRREPQRPKPSNPRRERDWKWAAGAAIVLALFATLAYAAYENRQPAAPLSNRALVRSENVSQALPFGSATVAPPPPVSNASARPGVSPVAPLPQHDAMPAAPTAAPPSPSARRAHHFRPAHDQTIADDEVIVHRAHTAPAPAPSGTVRHISDLAQ